MFTLIAFDRQHSLNESVLKRSPLLRKLLENHWKETTTQRIELFPNLADDAIDSFNFFLALNSLGRDESLLIVEDPYAIPSDDEGESETEDMSENEEGPSLRINPFSLFAAANYLQLDGLSNRCLMQIRESIARDNLLDTIAFANRYCIKNLEKVILKNVIAFLETFDEEELADTPFELFHSAICHDELRIGREFHRYHLMKRWMMATLKLQHTPLTSLPPYMLQVFHHVRSFLMTPDELNIIVREGLVPFQMIETQMRSRTDLASTVQESIRFGFDVRNISNDDQDGGNIYFHDGVLKHCPDEMECAVSFSVMDILERAIFHLNFQNNIPFFNVEISTHFLSSLLGCNVRAEISLDHQTRHQRFEMNSHPRQSDGFFASIPYQQAEPFICEDSLHLTLTIHITRF